MGQTLINFPLFVLLVKFRQINFLGIFPCLILKKEKFIPFYFGKMLLHQFEQVALARVNC